jgi:hypothetical protein
MNKPEQETNRHDQSALASALLKPEVYGNGVTQVDTLETHISHVFLAGPYAYKIKKAVDLGFLNFKTLSARRFYCHEELRLNRRFAPSLYLDVIAITGTPNHPVLGGDGTPIEYAVKMRRFSQDDLLSKVLTRGALSPGLIDQLAERIAEIHAAAPVATSRDNYGTPEVILQPALENFSQIHSSDPDTGNNADLDFLEQWTRAQSRALTALFTARKNDGFVRECHGDLHLGNVAWVDGAVTVFDCLEFNPGLRWIDIMNEVAFLFMDLHDRKKPELARRLLNRYLEITGDYESLRLLRFYTVYRALVRAKVHLLRANQADINADEKARLLDQYRDYIALAKNQTLPLTPALMITHGLSGSGKTTRTQSLLETAGAVRIRSDAERKRLHGLPALARTGAELTSGVYTDDASTHTYQRLSDLAKIIIEAGYTVIVDATFLKRRQRDEFRRLAETLNAPFVILDFVADENVLRTRILAREQQGRDASEAGIAVLEHQLATQEPLQADEQAWVERFDTAENISGA